MHFSTLLSLFAVAAHYATAAPMPVTYEVEDLDARYDASEYDLYEREFLDIGDLDLWERELDDEYDGLFARATRASWGNGITKAKQREVKAYVANLAGMARSCDMSGDVTQLTWHGCGKSGFSIGGVTPQTTTYCQGCYVKKKGKNEPTKPPYTWKTVIHRVNAPSQDNWITHYTTTDRLSPPSSKAIAQDILGWINGQGI